MGVVVVLTFGSSNSGWLARVRDGEGAMTYVGVLEVKSNLPKLIKTLEQGQEERVVIARNNRPVAQITLVDDESAPRIGVALGRWR